MFNELYKFLVVDNLSALVTFVVGLFVFIVYRLERTNSERASANVVLEEMRTIEKNISRLRESNNLISITPSSFSTQGWIQHRSSLVKYLDYDQATEINAFFDRVNSLREWIEQWRLSYFTSMEAKSQGMQHKLIDLAEKSTLEEYTTRKENITKIVHSDNYWFEPSAMKDQIMMLLPLLSPISTSAVGERIKAVTRRGWKNIIFA